MSSVEERIKEFNRQFPPESLRIKYQRMSVSPFTFFRGTCHLFYEDLSKENNLPQSPVSWISGDLHLENFGSYKADNRLVYFDLNDFNEAVQAPVTWELLRMATSILIALDLQKFQHGEIYDLAKFFLETYASVLSRGKARYIESKVAKGVVRRFLKKVSRRKERELLMDRAVRTRGGLRLNIDNERFFALDKNLKERLSVHIHDLIRQYSLNYHFIDVAFRIAGTGSIGIKRYLFLLRSNKEKNYLLVDMKEATPSCLQAYAPVKQPAWLNEAERMATVQNYMQNNCPALLSFTTFNDSSFLLKEMQPSEDKIKIVEIAEDYKSLGQLISDMAILTASAHIRSSGRRGSAVADELTLFGKSDHWQRSILDISLEYSKRMKGYYSEFMKKYDVEEFL